MPNLTSYTVTGTITDAHTVKLDESLPLQPGRVRVTVEADIGESPKTNGGISTYQHVMTAIRDRQTARGHTPPTPEDVERHLSAEREDWE